MLGGGMAGVTAAWELSRPGWRDRFDAITVYQRGWLLGGKGASTRGRRRPDPRARPARVAGLLRQRVPAAPRVLRRARPGAHRPGLSDPHVARRVRPRARRRRVRARRRSGRDLAGPVPDQRARARCAPDAPEPTLTDVVRRGVGLAAAAFGSGRTRGPARFGHRRRPRRHRHARRHRGRPAPGAGRVRPGRRRGLPRLARAVTAPDRRRSTAASSAACTTSSSATAKATTSGPRSRPASACSSRSACSSTTRARCSGR